MRVHGQRHARVDLDAHLDHFASGYAEIVPLQLGSLDAWLLRRRELQSRGAANGEDRYGDDATRFHGVLRF